MTGIFLRKARRRKFGHSSVSIRMIALGFTMSTMRNAIWVHAASVGEVVAASPIVRELKKKYPDEMVVVSVVTATGHRMAQRIIPEADGCSSQ